MISSKVIALRQKFQMKQADFSDLLGVSVSTVNRWEKDNSAEIPNYTSVPVELLAQALKEHSVESIRGELEKVGGRPVDVVRVLTRLGGTDVSGGGPRTRGAAPAKKTAKAVKAVRAMKAVAASSATKEKRKPGRKLGRKLGRKTLALKTPKAAKVLRETVTSVTPASTATKASRGSKVAKRKLSSKAVKGAKAMKPAKVMKPAKALNPTKRGPGRPRKSV
jgi:transcriptional regulator with XRE-family HTH domain